MNNKGIIVTQQIKGTDKTLYSYDSKTSLNVKGTFETIIQINKKSVQATVFVINGGSRDLLGKETAISLGVLKVGIGVNEVTQTTIPFPKFKNIIVEIPIDETCRPVSQPYRRIPIPIEKKVENKIQKLLDSDIIEQVHGFSQ